MFHRIEEIRRSIIRGSETAGVDPLGGQPGDWSEGENAVSFVYVPTAWSEHFPSFRVSFFVCFLLYRKVFGILVPQPRIEPIPPAVEARSLNC